MDTKFTVEGVWGGTVSFQISEGADTVLVSTYNEGGRSATVQMERAELVRTVQMMEAIDGN